MKKNVCTQYIGGLALVSKWGLDMLPTNVDNVDFKNRKEINRIN